MVFIGLCVQELATLKKTLEEDTQTHEVVITEMRHKHSQEIAEINEQLEVLKKVRILLSQSGCVLSLLDVVLFCFLFCFYSCNMIVVNISVEGRSREGQTVVRG